LHQPAPGPRPTRHQRVGGGDLDGLEAVPLAAEENGAALALADAAAHLGDRLRRRKHGLSEVALARGCGGEPLHVGGGGI